MLKVHDMMAQSPLSPRWVWLSTKAALLRTHLSCRGWPLGSGLESEKIIRLWTPVPGLADRGVFLESRLLVA